MYCLAYREGIDEGHVGGERVGELAARGVGKLVGLLRLVLLRRVESGGEREWTRKGRHTRGINR